MKKTEVEMLAFRRAKLLRQSPTEAESRLWSVIRAKNLGNVHFRRQHAIGPYIVDFCDITHKLIIEVDGSGHLDQEEYDERRTEYLESLGFTVLRFWNHDVMNYLEDVVEVICENIGE